MPDFSSTVDATPARPAADRPASSRYGAAVLSVALATLLRLLLQPLLSEDYPLTIYFAAVMFTAWYGGFRPALVALVLSFVAADFFFVPPRYSFGLKKFNDYVGLTLFVAVGLTVAGLSEAMHRARRRAEETASALGESEGRYRRLVEVLPEAVFVNQDDKIVFVNEAGIRLFGAGDPAQVVGKSPLEFFHPDHHAAIRERVGAALSQNQVLPIIEEIIVPLDGSEVAVEVAAATYVERGAPAVLVVVRDITERRSAEDARAAILAREQAARAQAEAASRSKDEFLATLSHELRTPLTPIMGWVQMIRAGRLSDDDVAHGLSVVDKNSQSLTRLINDLLDMSAIMSGKMRIESAPLELDAVLREAVETARAEADKRDVRIDIEFVPCDGDEPHTVAGDRTRLVQVFWNLLNNAVKFSPEGATVRLVCGYDGREARVRVSDGGEGIAPEFLPHVFERFRQADGSTTRAHGGLGIGLALVKSFVEAHGGTTRAASGGLGLGSDFTVTLPLLPRAREPQAPSRAGDDATEPDTAAAAPPPRDESSPRRALVVEDARDTLDLLQIFFERLGYEVTLCETAAEALRVAPAMWFDVIVSDIGLPQTDGYELIKRLRRLPHLSDTPAIALTGYAAPKDAEAALLAGFDVHVAKPVDPAALAEAVARLLKDKLKV